MRLYDTHCHFEENDGEKIAATLKRAKAVGVEKIMAVGGSAALNDSAITAARQGCALALGMDRDQISESGALEFEATKTCRDIRISAVGEIGLDYHYSPETRQAQMKLFAAQLERASRDGLPVVIHTREAAEDTIDMLKEIPSRGIIHCFTGTPTEVKAYLELGFYISISGIVTFRAADNVRETAKMIPDDRILIETDSPFLAPIPMRGNPNEPAFLRYTCAFLAKLRGMDEETFAELTFANAERIIGR